MYQIETEYMQDSHVKSAETTQWSKSTLLPGSTVSYHDVIFVLTPTVVRVEEVDIPLAELIYFEEVVQHAHDSIGSFTYIYSFVDSGVSRLVKLPGHLVDPVVTWEFETPIDLNFSKSNEKNLIYICNSYIPHSQNKWVDNP